MQLRNGRLVRTDMWREGEYLDLWSVPHFLSGMAVALGLAILGLTLPVATAVAFVMLVAWEFFEYFADIEEGRMNSMMDVVVGMFSFAPTFWWAMGTDMNAFVVAFVMLVAWEFFEYFADIEEGRMNSMMDVVVGMFSFAPTFWWAMGADSSTIVLAFIAITGIDLVISSFGWVATRKAYVLERALLDEFREKRESLREHKRELKDRFDDEKKRWRERRKLWKTRKRERLLARAARLENDIS